VPINAFNKICVDREAQEATVGIKLPPAPPPPQHSLRYLKCPQCTKLMNRYNFAHASGVVIDKCATHGIWLDRDDLRRVVEFVRAGGLTAAREHEIEVLKEQRSQLESDRTQLGRFAASGSYLRDDASANVLGGIASVFLSFFD
jgi:Zn-finger nucleic acid-binding protein